MATLIALAVASFSSRVQAAQALRVDPLNCRVRYRDGRCDLPDNRLLRIALTPATEATPLLLVDGHPVPLQRQEVVDDRRLIWIPIEAGARRLTVRSSDGLFAASATIDVAGRTEPTWLGEARRLLDANDTRAARQRLDDNLPAATDPADLAEGNNLLAELLFESTDLAGALRTFERARDFDRKAAMVGGTALGEARDTLDIARVMLLQARYAEAAETLRASAAVFGAAPELQPWSAMMSGQCALRLGLLDRAMLFFEESERTGLRVGDREALDQLKLTRFNYLVAVGRRAEALGDLRQVTWEALVPCRQANLADKFALYWLDAVEATGTDPTPPAKETIDPRYWAGRAVAIRSTKGAGGCYQPGPLLWERLLLARTHLVFGDHVHAEEVLAAMPRGDGDPPGVAVDRLDLEARIRFARGDLDGARDRFQRMRDLVIRDGSRGLDTADLYDGLWRSSLGLAKTWEKHERLRALAYFRLAERNLDDRAAPLAYADRFGFVGRHERGTAEFLAFLERQGRLDEALEVMRHARLRALLAPPSALRRPGGLEPRGVAVDAALDRYRADRLSQERALLELYGAAPGDDKRRRLRYKRLSEELLATASLLLPPAGDELAPPGPGELLLACHPAVGHWLCLLAAPRRPIVSFRLASLDERTSAAVVEKALSAALAPRLRGVRSLRILDYGATRQVDFGALRIGARLLEDTVAVVYPLDLQVPAPARLAKPGASPPAVVVIDPRGEKWQKWRPTAEAIEQSLKSAYRVRQHEAVPAGGVEAVSLLTDELADSDVAFLFAHGRSQIARGGWNRALWNEDEIGLLPADVFAARRVPLGVVLFGCGLDTPAVEIGGIESPTLALAFVMRGSRWMITSQLPEVDANVAGEMMTAIAAELATSRRASDEPPARELANARRTVMARHAGDAKAAALARLNLAAIRLIVQ